MVGPQWPEGGVGPGVGAAPERRPARRPGRPPWALALAVGLLGGACLGLRWQGGREGAPAGGWSPRQLLGAFGQAPAEEKLVFATTPQPPVRPADLLPAGAAGVYLFYDLPGLEPAAVPVVAWRRDRGRLLKVAPGDVTLGARPGTGTVLLRPPAGGLLPGVYEVDLAFPHSRVSGSFVAAWGAEAITGQPAPRDAEVLIAAAAFAAALDPGGRPLRPRKAFQPLERITFAFRYRQAEPGSAVQVKWYGGRECLQNATREIVLPSTEGWGNAWLQAPFPGLPPGTYRAALSMSGDVRELASAEFTVTGAAAPLSPPAPAR